MSQKLKPNRSDNRGGLRLNSGRKSNGEINYRRKVTAEEKTALDNLLKQLRQ